MYARVATVACDASISNLVVGHFTGLEPVHDLGRAGSGDESGGDLTGAFRHLSQLAHLESW